MEKDWEDLITIFFRSSSSTLSFPFVLIASLIVLLATGLIGNLGDDVRQEVQHLVFGDCVFQVRSGDALGIPFLGFFGGFGDEGDHEKF